MIVRKPKAGYLSVNTSTLKRRSASLREKENHLDSGPEGALLLDK